MDGVDTTDGVILVMVMVMAGVMAGVMVMVGDIQVGDTTHLIIHRIIRDTTNVLLMENDMLITPADLILVESIDQIPSIQDPADPAAGTLLQIIQVEEAEIAGQTKIAALIPIVQVIVVLLNVQFLVIIQEETIRAATEGPHQVRANHIHQATEAILQE